MKILIIIVTFYLTSISIGLICFTSEDTFFNTIKNIIKRHKVFILCDDMENVDKLYNEIIDYYSCRKSRRYDLIYKNKKMNLILKFTNISITEYYQTVLRIYMLQIDGVYLPKDKPIEVYSINAVKDSYKQIDLYEKLCLHIEKYVSKTNLIMIKNCKLYSDDMTYRVCVGSTNAIEYIKLLKTLLIIKNNLNTPTSNESSKDTDNHDVEKSQINTLPVLNTFKIIDGDIDDLSEFIDYFTDTDDYKIKSVYTNNKVNYSCDYKSSHIYLDAFLTDIQNIINMRYKKLTCDESKNKIANVMTVILDGNDNNINIRDIKKMMTYIKPEFIITISIESKVITFTDSDEYIIDYLKSRKHDNNDNM